MLLAGELAVMILVELGKVLLVRRTFYLLAREEAVVVLVEALEHLLGARFSRAGRPRCRRGAARLWRRRARRCARACRPASRCLVAARRRRTAARCLVAARRRGTAARGLVAARCLAGCL